MVYENEEDQTCLLTYSRRVYRVKLSALKGGACGAHAGQWILNLSIRGGKNGSSIAPFPKREIGIPGRS